MASTQLGAANPATIPLAAPDEGACQDALPLYPLLPRIAAVLQLFLRQQLGTAGQLCGAAGLKRVRGQWQRHGGISVVLGSHDGIATPPQRPARLRLTALPPTFLGSSHHRCTSPGPMTRRGAAAAARRPTAASTAAELSCCTAPQRQGRGVVLDGRGAAVAPGAAVRGAGAGGEKAGLPAARARWGTISLRRTCCSRLQCVSTAGCAAAGARRPAASMTAFAKWDGSA